MSFRIPGALMPLGRRLAVLCLVTLCARPVGAQTFPVTEWGPRIMSRVLYNVIRDTLAANRPGSAVATGQPGNGPVSSPTFVPSLERRRENVARRIAALRATDPAGAAELERVTSQGDTLAAFAARVRPFGVNAYSVSDAFAAWVTMMWEQLHPTVTAPGVVLTVRSQVDRALRDIPAFASATDAEKQEFSEALILHLLASADRLRAGRTDPGTQAAIFALLTKAGAELRVDFEHMTPTVQGFMSSDMVKPASKP